MTRRDVDTETTTPDSTEGAGDGTVLVLTGDLDVRSTESVRAVVNAHLAARAGEPEAVLVIDISAVPSIDATALRMVAAASRRAHRAGIRIRLRGARPTVLRMLHLTHLIRLVEVEREPIPA